MLGKYLQRYKMFFETILLQSLFFPLSLFMHILKKREMTMKLTKTAGDCKGT